MNKTNTNLPKLPVNLRPGFVPAGKAAPLSPAARAAFLIAEADRLDWTCGVAGDQHIGEPGDPQAPDAAALNLGKWWGG